MHQVSDFRRGGVGAGPGAPGAGEHTRVGYQGRLPARPALSRGSWARRYHTITTYSHSAWHPLRLAGPGRALNSCRPAGCGDLAACWLHACSPRMLSDCLCSVFWKAVTGLGCRGRCRGRCRVLTVPGGRGSRRRGRRERRWGRPWPDRCCCPRCCSPRGRRGWGSSWGTRPSCCRA